MAIGRPPRPVLERFWEKIRKGPGCWEWLCTRDKHGYGVFGIRVNNRGKQIRAHRMALELARGPIPDGLMALHACGNRGCCNPAHLYAGTAKENSADAERHGTIARGDRSGARLHPEVWTRGEAHYRAKLTAAQVAEMRMRAERGESHRSLARAFGISKSAAGYAIRGRSWRHVKSAQPA